MPRILTCPHGHRWESPAPPHGGTTILRTLCPVCGVSLQVAAEAPDAVNETTEHTPVPPALSSIETTDGVSGSSWSHEPPPPPPSSLETTDGESSGWPQVELTTGPTDVPGSDPGATTGDASPRAALPARTRAVVAGYEILSELGRGGMGVVYKARQVKASRLVALKMVLAGAHASAHQLRRFRIEAEAVARLQHPNVVQVFEVGEQDGLPFFSLEFCPGGTLADKLADSPLPPPRAAELTAQLARGVDAAHRSQIIHRDLKPANVLLTEDGTPKITDFGLARKLDVPEGYTATGIVMGTPSYMAPEQAEGRTHDIGPAADIYSLGAILYEAMIGRPPFKAATLVDTLVQVRSLEPVAPRALQPNLPRDLETICLKCLHKQPERRYASAGALADDLGRWLRGEPILARPTPLWERGYKAVRRRPGLSAMIALVVTITLLGVSLVTWQWRRAESERVKAQHLAEAEAAAKKKAEELAAAEAAAKTAAQRTATRLLIERGVGLCQRREVAPGLLWLARGLESAPEEAADLQDSLRALMGGWSRELCRLKWVAEHPSRVLAVDFRPDGKVVATGGWDKTVRLRDAATGQPIGRPMPHRARVTAVRFSPDGKTLLTLCGDNTGSLWDAATGEPRGSLPQHPARVHAAAFSPDGKQVLTACRDGKARLWDLATAKLTGAPLAHRGEVLAVAFSPDGKYLLTGSRDRTARVWDAQGKPLGGAMRHPRDVTAVAFSPDSQAVLTGCRDGLARLWQTAAGAPLGPPLAHQGQVNGVAFSPDGHTLLTTSDDGTCCLWARDGRQQRGEAIRHQGPVAAAAFSPDGRTILTAGWDGTARLWEESGNRPVLEIHATQAGLLAVLFSPDGRTLLTTGADNTARLWDAATGRPRGQPMAHASFINGALFSPDGNTLLTRSGSLLQLWDAQTGKRRSARQHASGINSAVFSPDSRFVLSASADWTAQLWDARTGQPVGQPFKHANVASAAVFSPDGRLLVTASLDGTAQLRRTDSGQAGHEPLRHGEPVAAAAFSPNGDILLTRGATSVRFWEVASGKALGSPVPCPGITETAVFSPDGKLVVIGALDKTARIVEAPSGRPVGEPLPHDDPVLEVVFSCDGGSFATRTVSSARLWRSRTAEPIGESLRHIGPLRAVAFSPDGKVLLTGGQDGAVRLWDAATSQPCGEVLANPEAVTALAFRPDGRAFAAAGEKGLLRQWQLPAPLAEEGERVRQWIQANTGLQLDPGGATVALDGPGWRRSWQKIEAPGSGRAR